MHTQTISTVSFAMAQLPANLVPDAAPRRPKRTTRSQSVRVTGQQAAAAAPSANVYVPDDVPFPDGTGVQVKTMTQPASRTKILVVAGLAAIVAVAGIALAMKFAGGNAAVAQVPADAAVITVSPIETGSGSAVAKVEPPRVEEPKPAVEPKPAIAATPDKPDPKPDTDKPGKPKTEKLDPDPKDKKVRDKTKGAKPETTATEAGPSRDQVIARYKAVRSEYQAFRSKNGDRLEQEWEELALYFQYHQNDSGAETLRRLDAFRAKIK
jgi:hypothetical protein